MISNEDIQNLHEMKVARRLELNRSLQFKNSMKNVQLDNQAMKMMNQNSSILHGLPQPVVSPTASLFMEELQKDENHQS